MKTTMPAPVSSTPGANVNSGYVAYVDAALRRESVLTYDSYVSWLLTEGVRYSGRVSL